MLALKLALERSIGLIITRAYGITIPVDLLVIAMVACALQLPRKPSPSDSRPGEMPSNNSPRPYFDWAWCDSLESGFILTIPSVTARWWRLSVDASSDSRIADAWVHALCAFRFR